MVNKVFQNEKKFLKYAKMELSKQSFKKDTFGGYITVFGKISLPWIDGCGGVRFFTDEYGNGYTVQKIEFRDNQFYLLTNEYGKRTCSGYKPSKRSLLSCLEHIGSGEQINVEQLRN